ncbi:MAG: hydrogen peroxide-inducible genes activator [Bacteriovoracaceae bacterium]
MVSITQLEYALAVYKMKNFVAAAKACNISQPTLSMQLKKLEEDIGYNLFDRSKAPVLVTDQGQKFINQALIVVHEFKKLSHIEEGPLLTGELKIGIIPTLAPYLIPLFLKNFLKTYPKVKLTLEELQTEHLLEKLNRDELDGGLLATPLKDQRLIERVLFYEPFYPYISTGHELYKKKKIHPSEIDTKDLWLLDQGHCLRTQILHLCSLSPENRNVQFSGGSLETLVKLVDEGLGMTILPYLATLRVKKDRLKEFTPEMPTREISLVAARSFYKEKLLDAFESSILETLPEELPSPKKGRLKILAPV